MTPSRRALSQLSVLSAVSLTYPLLFALIGAVSRGTLAISETYGAESYYHLHHQTSVSGSGHLVGVDGMKFGVDQDGKNLTQMAGLYLTIFGVCGGFLFLYVDQLSHVQYRGRKLFHESTLIVVGLLIMCVGFMCLITSWPTILSIFGIVITGTNDLPPLTPDAISAPKPTLHPTSEAASSFSSSTSSSSLSRFLIGNLLIWSIGSPLCQTLSISMLSKYLGPHRDQATWMGLATAAGSTGRIIIPMLGGLLYDYVTLDAAWLLGGLLSAVMTIYTCFVFLYYPLPF